MNVGIGGGGLFEILKQNHVQVHGHIILYFETKLFFQIIFHPFSAIAPPNALS